METNFLCVRCSEGILQAEGSQLSCSHCLSIYKMTDRIPVILPTEVQAAKYDEENTGYTVPQLQELYDRAYVHDGLMGTDLDEIYDKTTKTQLLSFLEPLANKRILDVGAGKGNLWGYIAANVEGFLLDLSYIGLGLATERHNSLTASISIAEFIPYRNQFFDAVIAADTIECTLASQRSLQEIYRVLKPEGAFSASISIPDSLRKWAWCQAIMHRCIGFKMWLRSAKILVW